MTRKRVLISLDEKTLEKLDKYADDRCMGNRSMAIFQILQDFFELKCP